jgi:hypothetical protein
MNAYEREVEQKTAENKDKPLTVHVPMCKVLCTQEPLFDINVRIAMNAKEAFVTAWNASNMQWLALIDLNKACCLYISYKQDDNGNYWGLIMPSSCH